MPELLRAAEQPPAEIPEEAESPEMPELLRAPVSGAVINTSIIHLLLYTSIFQEFFLKPINISLHHKIILMNQDYRQIGKLFISTTAN